MYTLVRPFVDLCLLRARPQDLPASRLLLVLTLIAHTLTGILASLQVLPASTALLAGITGTLMLAGMATLLLNIQGKRERITQTLSALAGSMAMLDLIALPLSAWWDRSHSGDSIDNPLPAFLLLALLGWNLAVMGHVLRHALGVAWFLGIAIAVAFYLVFMDIMKNLFPYPV